MKKARLLITQNCDKNCDGCCNKHSVFKPRVLNNLNELLNYNEVMITGGEPLLYPHRIITIIDFLRQNNFKGKIYLYSAKYIQKTYYELLQKIDGLHYTLHAEATDRDVSDLKELCNLITHSIFYGSSSETSFRLAIDKRLYAKYDFSNIDFSGWHVIRKMEWQMECPLPENEELLILGDAL